MSKVDDDIKILRGERSRITRDYTEADAAFDNVCRLAKLGETFENKETKEYLQIVEDRPTADYIFNGKEWVWKRSE